MEKFVINGGHKLFGSVQVPRSKNAFLPIMASTLLCDERVVLRQNPKYEDIFSLAKILQHLGKKVTFLGEDIIIESSGFAQSFVPESLASKLRSSVFVLGPLLAKMGHAKIAMPGGCKIGKRPIDLHVLAFEKLGATITQGSDFVECQGSLRPSIIEFGSASVGATENAMMASVLLDGTTKIFHSAKEPEIVDLANFLNKMGANILGAGTDEIEIRGVKKLFGGAYAPTSDRIFAGTMMLACAIAGGEIELENVEPAEVLSLSKVLQKCGFTIKSGCAKIKVQSNGRPMPAVIQTLPHPGFATDLQSQMLALLCFSKGVSVVQENVFETRFGTAIQLNKMGANIKVCGQKAVVFGRENLFGARVSATDLRGGAALVLAGLKAKGTTVVENVFHIDRGYFALEKTLSDLGADIKREG